MAGQAATVTCEVHSVAALVPQDLLLEAVQLGVGVGEVAELALRGGPVLVVGLQPVLGGLVHGLARDEHLQPVQPALQRVSRLWHVPGGRWARAGAG